MIKKTVASESIHQFMYDVMEKYHMELFGAEITVTIFMCEKVDKFGNSTHEPAIIRRGQRCDATIKKASPTDLGLGSGLLIMNIDALYWEDASDDDRIALIDHELCHFQLKRNAKTNEIELDGNDKPKLKAVPHDIEVGVFYDVIRRHGPDCADYKAMVNLHASCEAACRQYLGGEDE